MQSRNSGGARSPLPPPTGPFPSGSGKPAPCGQRRVDNAALPALSPSWAVLIGLSLLVATSSTATAATWRDAMATGDCRGVVEALPAPEKDVERLASARCLQRLGESARAAEVAAGVTDKRLRPYAAVVRAEALLSGDHPAGAAAALEGVELTGWQEELLRGRALVAAGRSADARDGLRALTEIRSVAPEARYWLARGAEDRGERDAALETYRAVWTRSPSDPFADRAAERLGAMGAPVPDAGTPEGRALMMERARAHLADKQADDALPLLDAVALAEPFDTEAEKLFIADALFEAKAYARSRAAYDALPGARQGAATLFQYALTTARAGDYPAAELLYAELGRSFPDSKEADEAAWKPGYMKHDAGDLAGAVTALGVYLDARPSGKFASDARWFRAWDMHRLGRDIEAATEMEKLLGAWPQIDLAVAARYWRARIQGDKKGYEQVLSLYPDSGYAWYAAMRLGKTWPSPPPAVRPELPAAWVAARPGVATARLLVDAGMPDWARPLLAGAVADAAKDQSTAIAMAWLLVDAEDYATARKLACPYKADRAALEACVVRPHHGAVSAIAAEHGLPALLPYAIMNAESGMDPSVTSQAGARGLMQLMPKLAADLAKNRIPGFHPSELYRAGVNARLGTTELGLLSRRWEPSAVKPSLPLVIASYNGGAAAVDRWLGGYATPPEIDEFAENISFSETRRYVRRVLGYLQQYRRVYGDAPPA